MYSQEDVQVISGKIRKNLLVLIPVVAAILIGYVAALAARVQWLAMLLGPALFVAVCYGLCAYIIPNVRYRNFLNDMQKGLSRQMRGTVVEIAQTAEPQDGAMVLPVRLLLTEEQDERIVYLNASKADRFPKPGTEVALQLYGRHIRSVEAVN